MKCFKCGKPLLPFIRYCRLLITNVDFPPDKWVHACSDPQCTESRFYQDPARRYALPSNPETMSSIERFRRAIEGFEMVAEEHLVRPLLEPTVIKLNNLLKAMQRGVKCEL